MRRRASRFPYLRFSLLLPLNSFYKIYTQSDCRQHPAWPLATSSGGELTALDRIAGEPRGRKPAIAAKTHYSGKIPGVVEAKEAIAEGD